MGERAGLAEVESRILLATPDAYKRRGSLAYTTRGFNSRPLISDYRMADSDRLSSTRVPSPGRLVLATERDMLPEQGHVTTFSGNGMGVGSARFAARKMPNRSSCQSSVPKQTAIVLRFEPQCHHTPRWNAHQEGRQRGHLPDWPDVLLATQDRHGTKVRALGRIVYCHRTSTRNPSLGS
jgi:hypothetical protein